MKSKSIILSIATVLILVGCGGGGSTSTTPINQAPSKVTLGDNLFNDTSLSFNKTMSCATCHDANNAFTDSRITNTTFGASLGDDEVSIGDRNTPSAAYAAFTPDFHLDTSEGIFKGGQFLDGRSLDLKDQAKGPFLNPLEMGMPDAASVVSRVKENPDYVQNLETLFGSEIFNDDEVAYDAIAECISEFEKTSEFATFDSKYDRFLSGDYNLSDSESRGLALFSNEAEEAGAGRCTACHPIEGEKALMTDFTYDNLGVPINQELRAVNGVGTTLDSGLFSNKDVNDTALQGAFKVSSLRNIAVTAPYMHNGKFKELKTVVHFYNTRDVDGATNPETNTSWEEGEFHAGRNTDELGNLGLSEQDEQDLVAFMKTFTDSRYESLIK